MTKDHKYKSDIPANAIEKELSPYRKWRGITTYRRTECLHKGKIVGYRHYGKDGSLFVEQPIKNGKIHGKVYYFENDGSVESIEPFYDGKPHGIAKQFDDDGSLLGTYTLNHGNGYDIWRDRDCETGKTYISEIWSYKDGLPHGFEWWVNWDQKTVGEERHWQHGKLHGIERSWHPQNRNRLLRGYPKYYVSGKHVTKRQYISCSKRDTTLPKFTEKDQKPRRDFPPKIKKIMIQR